MRDYLDWFFSIPRLHTCRFPKAPVELDLRTAVASLL